MFLNGYLFIINSHILTNIPTVVFVDCHHYLLKRISLVNESPEAQWD